LYFKFKKVQNIQIQIQKLLNVNIEDLSKSIHERMKVQSSIRKEQLIGLLVSVLLVCIGLNTSSYTALFGGLLLFPFLHSFYALGYGLFIKDLQIVHQSIKMILLVLVVSVGVSIIYFYITPIYISDGNIVKVAHISFSEILVAFIGGIAGFVSIIKNRFQVMMIAVSIATGIIIPLSIVGFGLIHSDFQLVHQSLYIFLVILFFIVSGAYILSFLLGIQQNVLKKSHQILIYSLTIVFFTTGVFYSSTLLKKAIATHNIESYLNEAISSNSCVIESKEIQFDEKKVEVYYTGFKPNAIQDESLKKKFKIKNYTFNYIEI
jgi:uncharacterized membrane protein